MDYSLDIQDANLRSSPHVNGIPLEGIMSHFLHAWPSLYLMKKNGQPFVNCSTF